MSKIRTQKQMEVIFREEWHHMGYDRNSVFTRAHQENEFPGQVENIAFIEKEIHVQPAYEKVTVIWRAIIRHKRNEINSAYSIFSLVNDLCSASASTVQCERDIKKCWKGPRSFDLKLLWPRMTLTVLNLQTKRIHFQKDAETILFLI